MIFGKLANYYNLGEESPLIILFSLFLHSLPMLHPPLRASGKTFIVKLTGESFRFGIFSKFNGLQFCYSVFQWQISSTEIYLILLLIAFAPKSFWILFYISKVVLKLHLDGKLQVTLVYHLHYKRDFSCCQSLWLLKCSTIYTALRTVICYGVTINITWFFRQVVIVWPLNLTSCGYSKFMKVICAFDALAYFIHVETPH